MPRCGRRRQDTVRPPPVLSYRQAMGTLSSELGAVLEHAAPVPRVYADANIPAGLVAYMRESLGWDVYFVMEHSDLRRAPDAEHFKLARRLHRTLITLDRDYFDDRRFPPGETGGIVVLSAPDERQLARVLSRVDRFLLRQVRPLPLTGLKVHAHLDWPVAPLEWPAR
jgi:predicted nuclease of predicted toxin-antitoxin system